jgi:hypothetical protein
MSVAEILIFSTRYNNSKSPWFSHHVNFRKLKTWGFIRILFFYRLSCLSSYNFVSSYQIFAFSFIYWQSIHNFETTRWNDVHILCKTNIKWTWISSFITIWSIWLCLCPTGFLVRIWILRCWNIVLPKFFYVTKINIRTTLLLLLSCRLPDTSSMF